jgi:hypothetical protein
VKDNHPVIEKGHQIGADSPEAVERADRMLRKILKPKDKPSKKGG